MAKGPSIKVEVTGLQQLLPRIDGDRLLRKPISKLFSSIGRRGREHGRQVAPRATGKLAASMTHRVSPKPIPTFVAIVNTARNKSGVSYPRILEYSPKHGHKGWLSTALKALMGRIRPEIDEAARDIEREFSAR